MSTGYIYHWVRTGLAGNIYVTDDPNSSGENVAFSINSCAAALQDVLRETDIPPDPNLAVQFSLIIWNGHLLATQVSKAA